MKTNEWRTPRGLFTAINYLYGPFTLDPAATAENALCPKFYTKELDGLKQSWKDERVFVNPPYDRTIGAWVEKCATDDSIITVALIPAWTDRIWWHKYVECRSKFCFSFNCDKSLHADEVSYLKRRVRYLLPDGKTVSGAMWPSAVVVWR